MLHENPLMLDIDVDHWRNLQHLLLDSAKEKRRIILIHEDGEILKFVHSAREEIVRSLDRIDDPHTAAETIYRDNVGKVDFVCVFERRAFDRYFAEFQSTWSPTEDLDAFVHRAYALLDDYADGIVTYPGPAREMLGLQWRIGSTYEEVQEAVERYVTPESTVVLGVFEGEALWTTLVLYFDADLRASVVTTMDMSRLAPVTGGDAIAKAVVAWAEERYGRCSIGLFTGLAEARGFIATEDKSAFLRELADTGALIAGPVPPTLAPVAH